MNNNEISLILETVKPGDILEFVCRGENHPLTCRVEAQHRFGCGKKSELVTVSLDNGATLCHLTGYWKFCDKNSACVNGLRDILSVVNVSGDGPKG